MHSLLIDGHPGTNRQASLLLDVYAANLPPGRVQSRFAVRGSSHSIPALPMALPGWEARIASAARSAHALRRQPKAMPSLPS